MQLPRLAGPRLVLGLFTVFEHAPGQRCDSDVSASDLALKPSGV